MSAETALRVSFRRAIHLGGIVNGEFQAAIQIQKEKSRQTKEDLKASASVLFNRKGFAATTIAAITKDAGYAKGTFYRYWKSKDDLLLAIMKERLAAYRSAREDGLRKANSVEDVMNVLIDFLESMIDDENWSKVFLEFTIHASGSATLQQQLNKDVYRLSSNLFADILSPFAGQEFPLKKIGALVTALFEGFLIQNLLETNVITKEDLRRAILTIALSSGRKQR